MLFAVRLMKQFKRPFYLPRVIAGGHRQYQRSLKAASSRIALGISVVYRID
jgi:hypothetical protein